jgi:hypothetical protein
MSARLMAHICTVPHPCAFFLAHGWETTNLNLSVDLETYTQPRT